MKITLSEEDAAHLGIPAQLVFDYSKLMGRDLLELEEQVGWGISDLETALNGVPVHNVIGGGPVYEMDGDKPKLDGGGKPIIARTLTTKTLLVMVWMCARRANPDLVWKTFDFNVAGADFDPGDEEEQGKGRTTARSRRSSTSTKPRSRRSSASPRGTSGTS